MKGTDVVTVCDACLRACCWNGVLMCDNALLAGPVDKTVAELRKLKLEHSDWWKPETYKRFPSGA